MGINQKLSARMVSRIIKAQYNTKNYNTKSMSTIIVIKNLEPIITSHIIRKQFVT